MLHKRRLAIMVVGFLLIAGGILVAASALVDQRASLSGQVSASGLVRVGAAVREGDILVRVDTLTGPVPAARATTNGVIKDVLVTPGVTIAVGDTVARMETSK